MIVFDRGFHGRTLLTLTMTEKVVYKAGFGPFAPEVYRVAAPVPVPRDHDRRCDRRARAAPEGGGRPGRSRLRGARAGAGRRRLHADAARLPRRLRELLDPHGILYVDDEVQSGAGRTGEIWALEHYDVEPDLIVAGKSLGGGLPLASVTGRAELMDAPAPGGLGGTFGGNPAACAAANATLDLLPGLLPRAREIGETVRARLERIAPEGADVRGLGPMLALELPEQRPDRAGAVLAARASRG